VVVLSNDGEVTAIFAAVASHVLAKLIKPEEE
jgi:hypothetical protein